MVAARARHKGQVVGYRRVSSIDQNEARQLDGIELDRVFIDKASGKDTKRPQLERALEFLREGDLLVVHSMDRLARNLDDLRKTGVRANKQGSERSVPKRVSDVHWRGLCHVQVAALCDRRVRRVRAVSDPREAMRRNRSGEKEGCLQRSQAFIVCRTSGRSSHESRSR